MPIVIPKEIPAYEILKRENIFAMDSARAMGQDIRPLEIAIVNLMPTKIETETQLMRLLSNTPLQVNVTLIRMKTHNARNTSEAHLDKFYTVFDKVKDRHFDGMIVTGAPVEKLEYESVNYWAELCGIFDFARDNVTSAVFICWGAQAALRYYYGIPKTELKKKVFGVFPCRATTRLDPLLKGLDDVFYIPHSRHTEIDRESVLNEPSLEILAEGEDCGLSIVKERDGSKLFFFGHSEYDRDTLGNEFARDREKGLDIDPPANYFTAEGKVDAKWVSTANILFSNWLNHYVYQVTPYSFD